MSRVVMFGFTLVLFHCGSSQPDSSLPVPGTDAAVGQDSATPQLDGGVPDQQAEAAVPPQQCNFKAITPAAALDPTFSTKPITVPVKDPIYSFSPINSFFAGLAIDSQHRALLPGDVYLINGGIVDVNAKLGTVRINANGTFDSAYGLASLNSFNLNGHPQTVVDSKDRLVVLTSNTLLRLDTSGHADSFGMVPIAQSYGTHLGVDGTDVYVGTEAGLVRYHEDGTVDSTFAPSLGQRKLRAYSFTPSCVLALTESSNAVFDPEHLECWKRSDGSIDSTYGTAGFATMPGKYFLTVFVLGQMTGDAIVVRVDGNQTNVDHVTANGALDAPYARTFPTAWQLVSSTCGHVFGATFAFAQGGKYDGKAQLFHLDLAGKDVNPSSTPIDSTLGTMDDARFDPNTGQLVMANGVTALARINPP